MGKGDQNNRCKGKTKQGKACQAAATAGGLCFFHANPNKAVELGRIGGKRNRRFVSDSLESHPRLETAKDVLETVARLIGDVQAGKLHPRMAAGLAPLLSLQLRAIQTTNIEDRIARLEKSMNGLQALDQRGERQVRHGEELSKTLQNELEGNHSEEQESHVTVTAR